MTYETGMLTDRYPDSVNWRRTDEATAENEKKGYYLDRRRDLPNAFERETSERRA